MLGGPCCGDACRLLHAQPLAMSMVCAQLHPSVQNMCQDGFVSREMCQDGVVSSTCVRREVGLCAKSVLALQHMSGMRCCLARRNDCLPPPPSPLCRSRLYSLSPLSEAQGCLP